MCQFKSGIIMKDRVFVPDYDSHTDMLDELGIEDNVQNAQTKFIRAELIPTNGDVFSDISTWRFNVDQDILPDWYVEEYDKQRMIEAVKEWAETHIHLGQDNLVIRDGAGHYIKDCTNVVIKGNATVKYICGNATVNNIYGNATVKNICDNATVKNIYDNATVDDIYDNATVDDIYGNATVDDIYDNATVKNIYDNATVKNIYDNATVIGSPYGWNNKDKMTINDNATFKDSETKTIVQAGDWTFKSV